MTTPKLTEAQRSNLALLRAAGSVTRDERSRFSEKGFHSVALDALVRARLVTVEHTEVKLRVMPPRHLRHLRRYKTPRYIVAYRSTYTPSGGRR